MNGAVAAAAAAAPTPASVPTNRCAVDPAPPTWSQVPACDIYRLNAVLCYWQRTFGDVNNTELLVAAGQPYCWRIYLLPSAQPGAANLARMREQPHVSDAVYDTNAVYAGNYGAVCVYVRRSDQTAGADTAECVDGQDSTSQRELATDAFFRTNRAHTRALADAFRQ